MILIGKAKIEQKQELGLLLALFQGQNMKKLLKLNKTLKFSDEVADIVQTIGRLVDDAIKVAKEIITVLKEGIRTSDDAIKVAKDIVGDL